MIYTKIVIAAVLLLTVAGCGNNSVEKEFVSANKDTDNQQKKVTRYTCPMHHQIRKNAPGKCPICGMTLIPVENNPTKTTDNTTAKLSIPLRQQFLANIHTDTARMGHLSDQLILTGTTFFDPQKTRTISARVSGWIEIMYIRNPGEKVRSGQKVYDLYSPDLLSAEKDYLLALKQKTAFQKASVDFRETIQALKQKLIRWGVSDAQIKSLKEGAAPSGKVSIYSKTTGYLNQKMKEEGDQVNEGDAVLSVVKNKTLWVQAQLYDTELPLMKENPKVWVEPAAFPGQKIPGKVVFNNPVNENDSRVHLLNIAIPNPDGKIQPGMLMYVHLQTSGETPVVTIPKSSVIYGEKNKYVWVELPDSTGDAKTGGFERHRVKLGKENEAMVEIQHGIKMGELVVSSGAYLINSEYILKHGSGVNMAGMQMSDMKMKGKSEN